MNALADAAAVDFQFGFPGTGAADAAGQPGQRRVGMRQPGQPVFELCQFHLNFPFPAVGAPGKNIQNELCAVDDFQARKVAD